MHCPGKLRKKNLKAGETEGYCKNCNRKMLDQQFGLSRDEYRHLQYTCLGQCKHQFRFRKDKDYCIASYCRPCYDEYYHQHGAFPAPAIFLKSRQSDLSTALATRQYRSLLDQSLASEFDPSESQATPARRVSSINCHSNVD